MLRESYYTFPSKVQLLAGSSFHTYTVVYKIENLQE